VNSVDKPEKPGWLRRLVNLLAGLVILLILLGLAGKWWIIPQAIRSEVTAELAKYWGGPIELAEVDFSYTGDRPIRMGGLSLRDANGHEWLHVGSVVLALRDWPGPHPYLTAVEVDRIDVRMHEGEGVGDPPLRAPRGEPSGPSTAAEYVDLRDIRIAELVASVLYGDGRAPARVHFAASAERQAGSTYAVRVDQTVPEPADNPVLLGQIDFATTRADLRFQLVGRPGVEAETLLRRAAGIGGLRITAGRAVIDGALAGRLDRPDTLTYDVRAHLIGLRLDADDARLVDDLTVRGRFTDANAVLTVLEASVPAGTLRIGRTPIQYSPATGAISARIESAELVANGKAPNNPYWQAVLGGTRARGRIELAGPVSYDPNRGLPIDFDLAVRPALAEVRIPGKVEQVLRNVTAGELKLRPTEVHVKDLAAEFARGRARLSGTLRLAPDNKTGAQNLADWARPERLVGGGHLAMDDVDLVTVPFLADLLQAVQVLPKEQKGVSDLHAVFFLKDGVATIEEAKLANPVSALSAERGGTIDLARGRLDLSVVVIAVKQTHALLKSIPLVGLAVNIRDKLTRFRIRGAWDDPPGKLVRKEPLRDLGEGAEEFFKGVIQTGGQLGPGIVRGIGSLLNELDKGLRGKPDKQAPSGATREEYP